MKICLEDFILLMCSSHLQTLYTPVDQSGSGPLPWSEIYIIIEYRFKMYFERENKNNFLCSYFRIKIGCKIDGVKHVFLIVDFLKIFLCIFMKRLCFANNSKTSKRNQFGTHES